MRTKLNKCWPLFWLHKNSGPRTTGFTERTTHLCQLDIREYLACVRPPTSNETSKLGVDYLSWQNKEIYIQLPLSGPDFSRQTPDEQQHMHTHTQQDLGSPTGGSWGGWRAKEPRHGLLPKCHETYIDHRCACLIIDVFDCLLFSNCRFGTWYLCFNRLRFEWCGD